MAKKKATKQEIKDFLEEFRARSRPRVEIEPRPEYLQFLTSKNLVEKDANDVILMELDYTHYISGPEDDYNKNLYPGPIWVFKIKKFDTMIYIKLKLYDGKYGPSAKCIAFHPSKN